MGLGAAFDVADGGEDCGDFDLKGGEFGGVRDELFLVVEETLREWLVTVIRLGVVSYSSDINLFLRVVFVVLQLISCPLQGLHLFLLRLYHPLRCLQPPPTLPEQIPQEHLRGLVHDNVVRVVPYWARLELEIARLVPPAHVMLDEHGRVERRDVARNLSDGVGELVERVLPTRGVELAAECPEGVEFVDAGFVEVLQ